MLLRTYKKEDAEKILKWVKNEREFRLWGACRHDSYPVTPNDINKNYSKRKDIYNFYPMTLEEDGKVIGHLILRLGDHDTTKEIVRLGHVIVDSSIRGKGYGKILINNAIKYARETLGAKKISLGVFLNNEGALHCYESVGFRITKIEKNAYQFYDEQWDLAEMILK